MSRTVTDISIRPYADEEEEIVPRFLAAHWPGSGLASGRRSGSAEDSWRTRERFRMFAPVGGTV
jgi:hypothetical protein